MLLFYKIYFKFNLHFVISARCEHVSYAGEVITEMKCWVIIKDARKKKAIFKELSEGRRVVHPSKYRGTIMLLFFGKKLSNFLFSSFSTLFFNTSLCSAS